MNTPFDTCSAHRGIRCMANQSAMLTPVNPDISLKFNKVHSIVYS